MNRISVARAVAGLTRMSPSLVRNIRGVPLWLHARISCQCRRRSNQDRNNDTECLVGGSGIPWSVYITLEES